MVYTKKQAEYKRSAKIRKCKHCKYYIHSRKCSWVKGDICPNATCKYWKKNE